jgi:hypothetical protein
LADSLVGWPAKRVTAKATTVTPLYWKQFAENGLRALTMKA